MFNDELECFSAKMQTICQIEFQGTRPCPESMAGCGALSAQEWRIKRPGEGERVSFPHFLEHAKERNLTKEQNALEKK